MIQSAASFSVGLFLVSPLVFWEIWKFVSPGLATKGNQRYRLYFRHYLLSAYLPWFFVLAPFSLLAFILYRKWPKYAKVWLPQLGLCVMSWWCLLFTSTLVFEFTRCFFFLPNLAFSDLNLCAHTEVWHLSFCCRCTITPPDVVSSLSLAYTTCITVAELEIVVAHMHISKRMIHIRISWFRISSAATLFLLFSCWYSWSWYFW